MKLLLSTTLFVLFTGVCYAQPSFVDGVELTTVKAPWTLRVLGNDLDITNVQAKPDEQSAYFMMTSESSKLNVSVFIEPVDKCKSSEECRDYVLRLGNPEWGKFQDLAKSKIKDFSYFEFYRPEVRGQPVKMLDMYAEFVSQGYWVDLHISKVLYTKEDHALFENVINSINFVPKSGQPSDSFKVQSAKGETSASVWLDLWGKMKCGESYRGLSPVARQSVSEKQWVDYCNTVNKGLGKNNSRNLIAAAFTKSRPPKSDRPLAILAYYSTFPNRESVVELIGLLLEKDGNWSVTNYLTR